MNLNLPDFLRGFSKGFDMKGQTTIRQDGTVQTEVIDREGQDCKNVYKITAQIGTQVSEEVTGPDCDSVHETSFD